jgi:hypothetical protein
VYRIKSLCYLHCTSVNVFGISLHSSLTSLIDRLFYSSLLRLVLCLTISQALIALWIEIWHLVWWYLRCKCFFKYKYKYCNANFSEVKGWQYHMLTWISSFCLLRHSDSNIPYYILSIWSNNANMYKASTLH